MAMQAPYVGNAVTRQAVSLFIPQIWSNEIKRYRDAKLIMAPMCKKIDIGSQGYGDYIHIPAISRMAVNDKLPETQVQLQAFQETEFTMLVDKFKEASFMVEDIVKIQSKVSMRTEYTREAGYALARDLDNSILALRACLKFSSQEVTASSVLDVASLLAAKALLDKADVPAENRYLVVAPSQVGSLLATTTFTSRDFIGDNQTILSGALPTNSLGCMLAVSTQISKNSATGYYNGSNSAGLPTPGTTGSPYFPSQVGAGATSLTNAKYTAVMFHSDCFALAMQQSPSSEAGREVTYQADVCVNTQIYGAKVYRVDHGVIIHSAET